jgi:hypothetical protein
MLCQRERERVMKLSKTLINNAAYLDENTECGVYYSTPL